MKQILEKILPIVGFGIVAGFLNGLLGAGGGIVIVMGLSLLFKERLHDPRAVFTSAIAVMLPLSLLSALRYVKNGNMTGDGVSFLIIPAILGGVTGALLLRRFTPDTLARIFAAVVLISGIVMAV